MQHDYVDGDELNGKPGSTERLETRVGLMIVVMRRTSSLVSGRQTYVNSVATTRKGSYERFLWH